MTTRADSVIYALPRSGSTLLASLMTVPGESWCLLEPSNAGGVRGTFKKHAREYIAAYERAHGASFGGHFDNEIFIGDIAERVERLKLKRWAAKEVFLREFLWTVNAFHPLKVVFLIRHPRRACLSYLRALGNPPWTFAGVIGPERSSDLAHFVRVYGQHCRNLMRTYFQWPSKEKMLVRYEELLVPEERDKIARDLDWPLIGDHNQGKPDERRDGIFAREDEPNEQLNELVEKELHGWMRDHGYA